MIHPLLTSFFRRYWIFSSQHSGWEKSLSDTMYVDTAGSVCAEKDRRSSYPCWLKSSLLLVGMYHICECLLRSRYWIVIRSFNPRHCTSTTSLWYLEIRYWGCFLLPFLVLLRLFNSELQNAAAAVGTIRLLASKVRVCTHNDARAHGEGESLFDTNTHWLISRILVSLVLLGIYR